MDSVTIALLIPLAVSVIANLFILLKRVKKSSCCGSMIEMADPVSEVAPSGVRSADIMSSPYWNTVRLPPVPPPSPGPVTISIISV